MNKKITAINKELEAIAKIQHDLRSDMKRAFKDPDTSMKDYVEMVNYLSMLTKEEWVLLQKRADLKTDWSHDWEDDTLNGEHDVD